VADFVAGRKCCSRRFIIVPLDVLLNCAAAVCSVARVAAFPIGIDPERFAQALETQEVQMNIAKLLNRYAGRKVGEPPSADAAVYAHIRADVPP
jgi:trehalose-6-phosphate synthase